MERMAILLKTVELVVIIALTKEVCYCIYVRYAQCIQCMLCVYMCGLYICVYVHILTLFILTCCLYVETVHGLHAIMLYTVCILIYNYIIVLTDMPHSVRVKMINRAMNANEQVIHNSELNFEENDRRLHFNLESLEVMHDRENPYSLEITVGGKLIAIDFKLTNPG